MIKLRKEDLKVWQLDQARQSITAWRSWSGGRNTGESAPAPRIVAAVDVSSDSGKTLAVDPETHFVRRWHATDSSLQRIIADTAHRTGIPKQVSPRCLRYSFASHLPINGVDIREVQALLGHSKVETTMIYLHVARGLRAPPRSPLDQL